jgi:hypothetical protein
MVTVDEIDVRRPSRGARGVARPVSKLGAVPE